MSRFQYRLLLLDIEGTTTPISFVHDVLFPYARSHMASFLQGRWEAPEVQADVAAIQQQHRADVAAGLAGVPELPETPGLEDVEALVAYLHWQMDGDRKTTGLKSLQGKIWREGYATGQLKGVIFDDVPEVLQAHQARGIPVYIYSSGSVQAQKLLFGQTTEGDLLGFLAGHFDTTTGPKKVAESYRVIADAVGVEPQQILFATDVLAEAEAAAQAGFQPVLLERPGNHPQPKHSFPVLAELRELL